MSPPRYRHEAVFEENILSPFYVIDIIILDEEISNSPGELYQVSIAL
jgi:hypothetical protein